MKDPYEEHEGHKVISSDPSSIHDENCCSFMYKESWCTASQKTTKLEQGNFLSLVSSFEFLVKGDRNA
jgi:hypothetical protein